jgi:hypothetical protein
MAEFYKIPQTIRPNSPFFGSLPTEYPGTGNFGWSAVMTSVARTKDEAD